MCVTVVNVVYCLNAVEVFNGMNKEAATAFEGFICPACFVDFPSAGKLQDHWLKFHSPSNETSDINDSCGQESKVYEETTTAQQDSHAFKSRLFKIPETCGLCGKPIKNEGYLCKGCRYCCHHMCLTMVKSVCPVKMPSSSSTNSKHSAPSSPKSLVSHLRHKVSKGRVRHVDKEFDLDLTYITERIIAMSFPGTGLESSYRNSLQDVAKMLQSKHQDKYMVFNLSERRYDISKLNHQVLDFGWPDHLAPPFERLCSIIKSIDSWLKSDPQHVVVVHCKGGKGRTGVVISAYMQFSKVCSSPQAALDWFAMKRFYDDRLGGVTQPSQRRYVHYFSDYLKGKVKLNADPIFLHHIIIHGVPNIDGKGGCRPFLRVCDGLKLIYTSGVFHVSSEMERICITIEGGLILHGDILIKCYHKNTLSSGRDIIFRCQFHTGAISDYGLVLDKSELDDACRDKRFPDDVKVEFVFSVTGNAVSEIKDNKRLQSIIQHSLQPVENPDTVLFPSRDSLAEGWNLLKRGQDGDKDHHKDRTAHQGIRGNSDRGTASLGTNEGRRPSCPAGSVAHVAGPLDGNLYAQIDNEFKTKLRSFSLDSGARSRGADHITVVQNTPNSLDFRHAYPTDREGARLASSKIPHYQYLDMSSSAHLASDADYSQQIHSIDRMLKELGNCTEIIDTTLQQSKVKKGRVDNVWHGDVPTSDAANKSSVSERVRFYDKQGWPMGTLSRRAGSFDEGEMRHHLNQEAASVPAKLGKRTMSAGQVEMEQILTSHRPKYSVKRTPVPASAPLASSSTMRQSPSPSAISGASQESPLLKTYQEQRAHTPPNGITAAAQVYFQRSGSLNQHRSGSPNQQWPSSPNQQRSGSPNQQWSSSPNQQWSSSPNQQWSGSLSQQWSSSPNQQRSGSPIQQWSSSPNQQRSGSLSQQWSSSPNQQRSGSLSQQKSGSPNQQWSSSPNQQRSGSLSEQWSSSPNQQRSGSLSQQRSGSPNQQWSSSPNQQRSGSLSQQRSGSPNQQSSGSPNQQSSGAQVAMSVTAQSRYKSQSPNSITTVAQIHHPRPRSPNSVAACMTPSPTESNGVRRSPKIPNGVLHDTAKVMVLPERSSPDNVVCEAPMVHTDPPMPPLSPKLYATTQTKPQLYNATTVARLQTGGQMHSGGEFDWSLNEPRLRREPQLNGTVARFTHVQTPLGGWQTTKEPRSGHLVDGAPPTQYDHSDINNNMNGSEMLVCREHSVDYGLDERPEQGTVASKIAYLTEIYSAEKSPRGDHYHPCRGTTVPLPGLSNKSPLDVSKEISEYNAKALAPGGLSYCTDTLYVTGAPPKKIIDRTPGKDLSVEPSSFVSDEFEQRVLARSKAAAAEVVEFAQYELSPAGSMDVCSIDTEVGCTGDADDLSALGHSPSVSSDGHGADSAFGGSSSVSTPVAGHSSNRFIPVLSTTTSNEADRSISTTSSPRSSLDEFSRSAREAQEDEESGYARLEDVVPIKERVLVSQTQQGQQQQALQEAAYRPDSNLSTETQATLRGSHSETPTIFDSCENVQPGVQCDLEAIDVILSEMTELSMKQSPPASPTLSSKAATLNSTGTPQSLSVSSTEGFDRQRNKSHPFSDMGYGSTNSVSSDSSSGDNVFVESPKIPGVKFVRDTSCYWYKPGITRDQAISLLKDKDPGAFVIRDSQSFPGAFGLAVKVAVPPSHVLKGDMSKVDLKTELVRHFLIESTKKGCRLKGCTEEPVFGSLSAFVYQHSITPLALPLMLTMPIEDLAPNGISRTKSENESNFAKGSAGSLIFLGCIGVEMLTGSSAVQRTVETLFKPALDSSKFTTIGFKVSPQGFTVTDNCRKMFFRRHFALSSIQYCGIDPLDKRWDLAASSCFGTKSRAFGIVLRTTGEVHNECHLFAESNKEWPSNILVNVINRYMSHKSS